MDLKKLVEAIDAQVLTGDIIGAFEQFAADECITHSNPQDITHSKGQKTEALRWFFSNVDSINNIARPAVSIVNDVETKSQFVFDFTNKQGQSLVYSEVIRRVWNAGKLVEEQYLFNETIAPATVAKKAKADVVAAPAAAKATEKKAAAPKADTKATPAKAEAKTPAPKKAAAPKAAVVAKADDLTLIEGIGPKIAELLQNAGIQSFADLAKAKPAAIKTILDAAGKKFQMHDPATWPKQSALARDGKSAELAKMQEELKGGK
jgi:predicted flap endonuclease-1-like 5' DNA nuclease